MGLKSFTAKVVIAVLSCCISVQSYAQGEAWNWFLADSVGIHFENGKTATPRFDFRILNNRMCEGVSTISTPSGRLLFYTNWRSLIDSNHQKVNTNFNFYDDYSSTQGDLIIKIKNSPYFHLFTTSAVPVPKNGFYHTVYEIEADTVKFNTINQELVRLTGEKQNAVNHRNNRDVWVVTHGLYNDSFFVYLVDSTGLIHCPVTSKTGETHYDRFIGQGQLKISPDGKFIAVSTYSLNRIDLFKFDNETGKLSDWISIPYISPYSLEFSSDSKKLYAIDRGKTLSQFDLSDYQLDSILNSNTTLHYSNTETKWAMQLAPDGRIYVTLNDTNDFIGVIKFPDSLGLACSYDSTGYSPGKRRWYGPLPNFNQSYFYKPAADFSYALNCEDNSMHLEAQDTIAATTFNWRFTHISSGISDARSGQAINYTFTGTGQYTIALIVTDGLISDTVTKLVTIYPVLMPGFLGKDTVYCAGTTPLFSFQVPDNMHCIEWQDGSNGTAYTTDTAGIYYVSICNKAFCRQTDTIKIKERPVPPSPLLGEDLSYCSNSRAPIVLQATPGVDCYRWNDGSSGNTYQTDTAGVYTVTVCDTNFCIASDTVIIMELPVPGKPTLSQQHDTLKAGNATGITKFRWYINGVLVDSTVIGSFKLTQTGTYKVETVANNGCASLSDSLSVTVLNIAKVSKADFSFNLYPNPTSNDVTVVCDKEGSYRVEIFDMAGKLWYNSTFTGKQKTVILDKAVPGIYLVKVWNQDGNLFTTRFGKE